MRLKIHILAIGASALLVSCGAGRHVVTQKVDHAEKKDSTRVTVDTSKAISYSQDKTTTVLGDSLTGSLQYTPEQVDAFDSLALAEAWEDNSIQEDSIESAGIKVKVRFIPLKKGAVKARITAVAKPKQIENTSTKIEISQTGKSDSTRAVSESRQIQFSKDKTIKAFPWVKIIVWVSLLLILIILTILYILKKRYGKIIFPFSWFTSWQRSSKGS